MSVLSFSPCLLCDFVGMLFDPLSLLASQIGTPTEVISPHYAWKAARKALQVVINPLKQEVAPLIRKSLDSLPPEYKHFPRLHQRRATFHY